VIPELGLAISIANNVGPAPVSDSLIRQTNGFIEATLTFKDPSNVWLTGIHDEEQSGFPKGLPNPSNWIRSGNYIDDKSVCGYNPNLDDVYLSPRINSRDPHIEAVDPRQAYENILGGIIAPAGLVSRSENYQDYHCNATTDVRPLHGSVLTLGPLPSSNNVYGYDDQRINNINSVDIVFTPDRTKWSKCIVIEMGEVKGQNEGNAAKFDLRAHANPFTIVNGVPVYNPGANTDPGEIGRSWFPGYAINVETGERLNIIFGEDSHLSGSENGGDMLWNPTNHLANYGYINPVADVTQYQSRFFWAGKHWIYVMGSRNPTVASSVKTSIKNSSDPDIKRFNAERGVAYDECNAYYKFLTSSGSIQKADAQAAVFSSAMWVMPPALTAGSALTSPEKGFIPTETKIRLRVATPYATYKKAGGNPINSNQPFYRFNTGDVAPTTTTQLGQDALKLANIVPNPYYAYSSYETSQLDNRVRMTNLPRKCKVSIYTVDGSLVRRYNIDQAVSEESPLHTTFLDWDLKNTAGVPVASGVYLIHIDAGELGSKVLKWFGVMRPLDLDTF
jgi:hypothetical protein